MISRTTGPFAGERAIHANLEQAKYCAFRVRSLVAFVDALDVKQSASRGGLIRMAKRAAHRVGWHERPGFDHSKTWYRPSGYIRGGWADCEYLFSTEPYVDVAPVEAFCSAIGWPLYLCRPGIGLWNPAGGTRLILISPPGRGLPLEEIGPLVDAAFSEWRGVNRPSTERYQRSIDLSLGRHPSWDRGAVLSYFAFMSGPGLDCAFHKRPEIRFF